MPLLKIDQDLLHPVRETEIELEKDLQALTEKNLTTVFGLQFVSSEYALNSLRIDSLAYDPETKAFVIIEYKRDRSFSVIDQGFAYLSLMLNNKADFILEYNEKTGSHLKRDDIDWTQSRVLFLAQGFTAHQLQAINFKDLPIEIWEVKKYGDDLIAYNQIQAKRFSESIKTVTQSEVVSTVSREVHVYSTDEFLEKLKEPARTYMEELRTQIMELDGRFEEKANKRYLAYKINGKNILAIGSSSSDLAVTFTRILPEDIHDPEKKAHLRNSSEEVYGQKLTDISVKEAGDVPYVLGLLRQVIAFHTKNGTI